MHPLQTPNGEHRRPDDRSTVVVPAISRWQQIRERFRRCPSSEVEQNVVRILILTVLIMYGIGNWVLTGNDMGQFLPVCAAYIGYGMVVLIWIYYKPEKFVVRRALHTLVDRSMITAALLAFGEWLSPMYVIYIWSDIGNAARYGRTYLYWSTACSAVGFGIVLLFSDYWRSLGILGIGLWFGILLVPYYASLFLKRLNDANERLNELATRDPLTLLPNRPFFYERLHEAIAVADRHKRRFSVLFVDLDDFKRINDTHGHDAGDEALRAIAHILRALVRQGDTVARIGGDEFLLLLLDAHGDDIYYIGENIREALAAYPKDRLSASIGIAVYPACGRDAESLVRHADRAMYAAKQAGKGRCRVCSDFTDH